MKNKLGKLPARKTAKRLWLHNYIDRSTLKIDSAPNYDFGEAAIVADADAWNDPLGNDQWGNCFWAAAVRNAMTKLANESLLMSFTAAGMTTVALNAYAACCGFNASTGNDPGTDALAGMNFLQKTGLTMPDGSVHRIGSYVWVNPQDFETLVLAHNLFEGLMLGLEFPGSWEDADVWDVVTDPIEGGHEVFGYSDVSVTPNGIILDSWGTKRIITVAAIAQFADEIAVSISPEMFGPNGKAITGFDAERLQADESALAVPSPE